MSLTDMPDALTVKEAAPILRRSENAIRKAIHRGDIRAIPFGDSRLIIPKSEMERLLNAR